MDPASVLGHDGQVRPLRRRLLRVPGLAASSLLLLEACTGSASHAQAAGATDAGTVADSTTSGDSPFPTDSAGPIDAPRADSKAPTTDGASTLTAKELDYNLNTKDAEVHGGPAVLTKPEGPPPAPKPAKSP